MSTYSDLLIYQHADSLPSYGFQRGYKYMNVTTIKKIKFYTIYSIVVAALALITLEVAASYFIKSKMDNALSIFEGILLSNQNILEPKTDYTEEWKTPEFHFTIRTNNRGFREEFDFKDNEIDVAYMGDSFTFGHGVDIHDRYSNVAAKIHPHLKVVSLSYNNGFQPEHYEYFLGLHPDIRPKVLFVGLYLGNDLDSDLNETIVERDNKGKIINLQLPYRDVYRGVIINKANFKYGWLSFLVETTNLGKLLAIKINSNYELRKLYTPSVKINSPNRLSTDLGEFDQHNLRTIKALTKIKDIIKSRDGELHVLMIPQNFFVGDVNRPHVAPESMSKIEEIKSQNGLIQTTLKLCGEEKLRCHDLSKLLTIQDYLAQDGHWKASGHKKVGEYTGKIIADNIKTRSE